MHDEKAIIQSILAGNCQAFAQLINRHQQQVYNYVLFLLKNNEDADEITQDCFVKAYRNLKSFRHDARFSTWILRIAHNSAMTVLRKKRYSTVDIEQAKQLMDNSGSDYNLNRNELSTMLHAALDELKPDEQSVITLFYFNEKSVHEIATITRLSVSNIKVKLMRSRKKLEQILSHTEIKAWME
ncbi:MAG: sigma-70 family RNA polymerase sigma factor [Cyclobacteriaceae bacterium]